MSQLATDLGLIERWRRQYRSWNTADRTRAVINLASVSRRLSAQVLHLALLDSDESVRLHTARAMLSNLEPGELAQVFGLAVNGPLVTRMILAEDLRRYALELAEEAIPAVLTCGVSGPVLSALQMLRAWGKFLPVSEVYALLRHPNPAVRAAAFDVLPLVPQAEPMKTEILHALNDPSEEVRSAAARAAAGRRVYEAVPLLARQLQQSPTVAALAAASALADLGADGCRILEEETIAGSPHTASVALEALERVRISSVEAVAI
jgi:HEAT repeat protein